MSIGTCSDLTEYLNLNRHIFEKEKNNNEHMERIMSMLTQENMEILEKQFELYPKGLELPTFLYLMKKLYTPENQLAKYYFVSDLIKFFQAIDINGDGHLEWSEFTEYIIENIRRVEKPNYKNKTFQENQVISSAYSKISNQYKIVKVIDTNTNNCIKKVIYASKELKYYMLEAGSNIIRIYDSKFQLLDFIEFKGESENSYISDFSLDKHNQILGAIFEGGAKFCNLKLIGNIKSLNECDNKKLKNYHKMQHLGLHRCWAFLSKAGQLKLCSASYKSRTLIQYQVISVIKQHDTLITDICELEDPLYLMTSSMDGNIKFYSTTLKKTVQLEHISDQTPSAINHKFKKGIIGVDYTREFGSYILSFGFCSSIYIYSLDISLVKGFTGKYNEHTGNLLNAKFLKSFPYVLSFDDKLNMRIWDFRTFQTIQIINCQKNFINPSKLEIIPELSECLVCQKKITQFRAPSLQKKSKEINQFHSISDFKICTMTGNIFVFTSNDVRVYNFITGCLQKVFTKLNENNFETNISACQFGYKCSKFFIGDAGGFVREYSSETGEFLQDIRPDESNEFQNKSIVKIIFLKQHSILIVCSLDGRILIYERNSQSEFQLLRDIRESHFELTCAAASTRYCTLATGSEDGVLNLWNLEKFVLEAVLLFKNKIIHIAFSPIHPIMFVVQSTGQISIFYIRPYENITLRNKCFAKLILCDMQSLTSFTSITFDLILSNYFKKSNPLVVGIEANHHMIMTIGKEDGTILVFNLHSIFEEFKIEPNHQICTIKKSIKCEIHSLKTTIANEKKKILLVGYSNQNVEIVHLEKITNCIQVEAHHQAVDKLLLVKENSIIISTSSDKKLKLWNFLGELNGAIDFFTFKKINWKVAEMNFYNKLQAIDTTIYSMKLIQNKRLTPPEEQFIKINLLINEYMNAQERQEYITWISLLRKNRRRHPKFTRKLTPSRIQTNNVDVRDEIQKFDVNGYEDADQELKQVDAETAEFNAIYHKLVNNIKLQLEGSTEISTTTKQNITSLPRLSENRRFFDGKDQRNIIKNQANIRESTEKQYQRLFNKTINQKEKPKKKMCNMLYQSLIEVRKNIEVMEKHENKKKKIF